MLAPLFITVFAAPPPVAPPTGIMAIGLPPMRLLDAFGRRLRGLFGGAG